MVVTATAAGEETLLEQVASGDREAFGTLVRPHLSGLLAFAVPVAPDPAAEETAGRRALLSVVDAELRKLPRDWRAAILLRHHAGYPPEEIAQILDRPSGTIKAWIHRGTRRVRAALPDDIVEGGYQ